ncbi:MAG: aminopeptidase P family protein [Actinomycetota bacterium]|nr:aminopeptidase P family protein [Actinomycetota bacterium]
MATKETVSYHNARVDKVRDWLTSEEVSFVAFDPVTVQWLTGFTGSNGSVYLDSENFILFTDNRYRLQAPEQLIENNSSAECRICLEPFTGIAELNKDQSIVLDGERVSWAQKKRLSAEVTSKVRDTQTPIRKLRSVKDQLEIERITTAATIASEALSETIKTLNESTTEKEMAANLDYKMKLLGASGPAYPPIVASGVNSSYPHAIPTETVINDNSLLLVDVGAQYKGYRSDMTRTISVGPLSAQENELLELVKEAQKLAIREIKPGIEAKHVDLACRNFLHDKGYGDLFIHGTGHGVGLEIHEFPRINNRSEDVLEEGMVITVEPGVYLQESFGVRWEDLLLVTADGVEFLT